jgi:hypothetical protein
VNGALPEMAMALVVAASGLITAFRLRRFLLAIGYDIRLKILGVDREKRRELALDVARLDLGVDRNPRQPEMRESVADQPEPTKPASLEAVPDSTAPEDPDPEAPKAA